MMPIFVGRQNILTSFESSLEQTQAAFKKNKRYRSFSSGVLLEEPHPRIYHFGGDGGFGKSLLLTKCLEIAVLIHPINGIFLRRNQTLYPYLLKHLPNFIYSPQLKMRQKLLTFSHVHRAE